MASKPSQTQYEVVSNTSAWIVKVATPLLVLAIAFCGSQLMTMSTSMAVMQTEIAELNRRLESSTQDRYDSKMAFADRQSMLTMIQNLENRLDKQDDDIKENEQNIRKLTEKIYRK